MTLPIRWSFGVRPRSPDRSSALRLFASLGIALAALVVASPAIAIPCASPDECATGFCVDGVCCDVACTGACQACSAAAKGGGLDGTCGPAAQGSPCGEPHCDDASFSFVDKGTCNASGTCTLPTPVPCLKENPCAFDLCSDTGCDSSVKLDGTPCGEKEEDKLVCVNGACVSSMSSSSSSGGSSSTSGAGASGSAGAGGSNGAGGSPGGAGGTSGGAGGAGGAIEIYPPAQEDTGCGCHAAGSASRSGAAALGLGLFAWLVWRRRGRASAHG